MKKLLSLILFLVMVIITFSLAKLYNNVLKPTSVLYKYAKNIRKIQMERN